MTEIKRFPKAPKPEKGSLYPIKSENRTFNAVI